MFDFYSIETEVKYRKEQLNNLLPKVEDHKRESLMFKIKQLYTKIKSQKTEEVTKCECECVC